MAKLEYECQNCEMPVIADGGQTSVDGVLRWYLAYTCQRCEAAIELDGTDETPSEIRKALISETGEWELHSSDLQDRVRLARALRSVLDLSIKDASKIAKQGSGPLFRGTRPEVEWLRCALEEHGVESTALLIQLV